jgi:hypothetical protein
MATRPSELFAISATVLLLFSFLSRLLATQSSLSITVGSVAYAFPPSTVSLIMASLLCFFAAIYSIWPLPLNPTAAVWHYWITAFAMAAFWACFYFFAFHVLRDSKITPVQTIALFGQFVSLIVVAFAQTIFVGNLVFTVVQLRLSGKY